MEDGWARGWRTWGQAEVPPRPTGGPSRSQRPPARPNWGTGLVLCELSSQRGGWLLALKYANVLNLQ